MFKIFKGFTNITKTQKPISQWTVLTQQETTVKKIIGKRFENNEDEYFFFHRAVNIWNEPTHSPTHLLTH